MNTRRNVTRKIEEEVANEEASPHDELFPPLEEDANVEQALANPSTMMEAEMGTILSQMDQAMTIQVEAMKVQEQAMTTQANWDISPHPHQEVTTRASRLRDFSQMNPPTFYGTKANEDPQEFIDEVYVIIYAMGVS